MADQTIDARWYDALGTLYEVIASRNKCSWMGQFFTPASLCDMMAQLQAGDVSDDASTANDPACGSGRTLLALNAIRPGLYFVAQDLDPICTKMAAINMAFHGIKGQSVNGNTLQPDEFIFGYEVNPRLYTIGGLPHLVPITRETSYVHNLWEKRLEQPSAPEPRKTEKPAQNLAGLPATQLSIF